MSKALLRLAQEMKESVAGIDKTLDKLIETARISDTFAIQKNMQNTRTIMKNLFEIYDRIMEFDTVISNNNNLKYEDRIAPSGHIKIGISENKILIKMGRIPSRKQSPKMVVEDLYQSFFQLKKERTSIPKLPKKVIEITHVYPVDFAPEIIKDNDNYNLKAIIDALCFFTSGSDRGDNCWIVYKTKIAGDYFAGTEIRIYPQTK